MISINYFTEKECKDAIFLCNICTILMIMEGTHMSWGGKHKIKIDQFSWKWEFFHYHELESLKVNHISTYTAEDGFPT